MEIENLYGFLYITTNLINGKRYIGQKKINDNWKNYLGSGRNLERAVKKYGKENFHRDIIGLAYSKEELNEMEYQSIKNHKANINLNYYNIAEGGNSGNKIEGMSEEAKRIRGERISKANSGDKNCNYGKVFSEETRRRISESNKGKVVSLETRQKLSKLFKGRKISEKQKLQIGVAHKGINNHGAIKIICLNSGEIFDYAKQATEKYGYSYRTLIDCLNGRSYSCGINNVNGEPLAWMKYDKYLESSESEVKNCINNAVGNNKRRVICVNTNEVFGTVTFASNKYNCQTGDICKCCDGRINHAGKMEDGTPLIWRYYDYNTYIPLTEEEINSIIYKINNKNKRGNHVSSKKVVLINNGQVFDSLSSVEDIYNIKHNHICSCCKNKRSYCGIMKDGITPMVWAYYDDYIKMDEKEIKYKILNATKVSNKKVVCITTNEIFNTNKEACNKYNLNETVLDSCCRGRIPNYSKSENGEKLKWMYYLDYYYIMENSKK